MVQLYGKIRYLRKYQWGPQWINVKSELVEIECELIFFAHSGSGFDN